MNVLLVTYDYVPKPVWGMGQHVSDLRNVLVEKGHNIKVITVNRYGLLDKGNLEVIFNECHGRVEDNIKAKKCTSKIYLKTCLDELYLVSINRLTEEGFIPDIIHCHGWMMIDTCMKLAQHYSVPIVTTIHFLEKQYDSVGGHPYPEQVKAILDKEFLMISQSECLICVSNYGYDLATQLYGEHIKDIRIVPHGIDLRSIRFTADKGQLEGRKIRFLFVGRLEKEKGIYELCSAMDDPEILNYAELTIIGTGSLDAELRSQFGSRYQFLGYCEHELVYSNMTKADYLVVPSVNEQFGLVALEGIAAGCIPIVSNVGGLQQIMKTMRGFLVNLNSTTNPSISLEMLKKIIYNAIHIDQNLLRTMRLENYAEVCANYSIDTMYERTITIYKDTAEKIM